MRGVIVGVATLVCAACFTSLDGFSGGTTDAGSNRSSSGSLLEAGVAIDGASAVGAGPATYRDEVLEDKPVAYWRLGESTAGTAVNEVAGGPVGTYAKAVTVGVPGATGDGNTAVTFKGGYIDGTDDFDFAAHDFSMELWVVPPATMASAAYPRILSKEKFSPTQEGWHFEMNSSFSVSFGIHRNDADIFVDTGALPANQFAHVVVTYDLTALRLYLNGVLRESKPATMQIIDTSSPVTIGASPNHADPFGGTVDDIALYDHVLSLERAAAHFRAAKR